MPLLPLATASIYYELFPASPTPSPTTSGPLLLMIHGGNGTLNNFRQLATHLTTTYPTLTTLLYDRRGFSRSPLTGPQSYRDRDRIGTDAADAAALIKRFSSTGTAIVFGNSSGALVGMELLARHPEAVEQFVCHEPPALSVIADAAVRERWLRGQREFYDLYREQGHVVAMGKFAELVRAGDDAGWATGARKEENPYFVGNLIYWFEREVLGYVAGEFDLGALEREKGKLILCNGKGTHVETPQAIPNREMGRRFGLEVEMFGGGHLAWQVDVETFAEDLRRVLGKRGVVLGKEADR